MAEEQQAAVPAEAPSVEQDLTEDKAAEPTDSKASEKPADGKTSSEGKPKKKKKKSAVYYAVTFFAKIGLTALAVWALLTYVGGVSMCHDNSAYPMIKDGDLILSYRLDPLRQGDVVVYRVDGIARFGRVIALGGDTVDIAGEYVDVNGYGLYENTVYPTSAEGAKISFPYTVPQDSVFVLNDYRSDMNDSRNYGAIPISETEGKAVFVIRRRGI